MIDDVRSVPWLVCCAFYQRLTVSCCILQIGLFTSVVLLLVLEPLVPNPVAISSNSVEVSLGVFTSAVLLLSSTVECWAPDPAVIGSNPVEVNLIFSLRLCCFLAQRQSNGSIC